ncbi:MAG TPA: SpoIIE family protein phosphatase [Thermoanaerobaculia bacterium]|nr:SpoIIE family protein phosphatase [Thermoanaerobaculia bacterium]
MVHEAIHPADNRSRKILDLAKQIHSTLELDDILATFLKLSVQELGTDGGTIYFLNSDGCLESKHIISSHKISKIVLNPGEGIAGLVAERGTSVIREDVQEDHQFSSIIDERYGFHTRNLICFPLKDHQGEVIGVLQLVNKRSGAFEDSDISFLEDISTFVALAVKNAQYYADSMERARMAQEIKVAHDIQQSLLPSEDPDIKGFTVASLFIPCYEVAGDFFNFYSDEEAAHIVLIDVSGKGVGAAMVASALHIYLSLRLTSNVSMSGFVHELNDYLHATLNGEHYATGIFLRIRQNGEMEYVSAGHPPILVAGSGAERSYPSTGLPLGILPDRFFDCLPLELYPGESACLYSDGFNETLDPDDEEFGIEGVQGSLTRHSPGSPRDIITGIHQDILDFQKGTQGNDDRTLIVVNRN